jgi:hypothetical protein
MRKRKKSSLKEKCKDNGKKARNPRSQAQGWKKVEEQPTS